MRLQPAVLSSICVRQAARLALAVLLPLCAANAPSFAAELQIEEGVVVKFGADAQMVVRDRLIQGAGVVLTSQKDDTLGGQTGATPQTPAAGDWRGLRFEKSSAAFGTLSLSDLSIRFAGGLHAGASGAGLSLRGVGGTLNYLQVSDSVNGVRLTDGAAVQMLGASLVRNVTGLESTNSNASITASRFALNTAYALRNDTPAGAITATGNWWGDASGPGDTTGNPAGRGEAVSPGVTYGGFLSAAPIIHPTVRLAAPAAFFETRNVLLDLSAAGATQYRIVEGTAFGNQPFTTLADGRAQAAFTVSEGDGRKPVTVEFRDAAGTTAMAQLDGGVPYDVAAPALDVTSPAENATISEPITITAVASDGSGIARVEFYLDNQLQGTATQAPYALSWDPTPSAEGAHFWRFVATDTAGRQTTLIRNITVSRADTQGPALSNATLGGTALVNGLVVTRNSVATVQASDRSGLSRVELLLDSAVVAAGTETAAGTYSAPLNITAIPNGAHTLAWRATDSIGNSGTLSFSVQVAHAAPDAPTITQPQNGLLTRTASLAVAGTAPAGSQVQLLLSGQPAGAPSVAASDGRFSAAVTLAQGANSLQATATNSYGTSAPSAAVTVTLDTTVPASPGTLAATGMPGGLVRLSWLRSTDSNAAGYQVYRSSSAFADIAAATRISGNAALAATGYDDLPPGEGVWFYRVVAVNASGTASAPSNQAQALADSVLPRALSIVYTPQGKVDAASGRIGQGRVDVVLTVSETLQAAPYLAIVPAGGSPVAVTLNPGSSAVYRGSFVIDDGMPSGTASVSFSARDTVGNRGTDIDAGASLKIDTEGPTLTGITLAPASPIKNDPAATVQATFSYSKALKAAPQLSYLLSGPVRAPLPIANLTQVNATTWQAQFTLVSDAGAGAPEGLRFTSQASDDLDNISTKITAGNAFQVFQGPLPPLDVPSAFTAKAQPGGKVRLGWAAVADAAAYQVYRQGPGQTSLQPLARASGIDYIDQTPADGRYTYAVASVRQANGQEAVSGQSASVEVLASANAPGAPQNLALQLTGQGIFVQWQAPPASDVAGYNLYRAAGTAITSVQGLTPFKSGITATAALDTSPSPGQGAYAVTALDSAGNESAPSNSAYLNASLLPVTNVRVEQIDANLPSLHWSPPNGDVSGFLVYVGPDAKKTRLTPSPISSLSFTDTGYSAGERRYTIASVDGNGAEMPRTVLLPAVSTDIVAGLPLQRGIMNRLQVQVANTSTATLAGVRVVVRVPVNKDSTQFKDHYSETFSLGSNQTRLVGVVVGGYADLPATAQAQVGVEIAPNEGELVKIARSQTLAIGDGTLVVGMTTEDFTRGGTGKVKLTVENTSEVEVELLTATSNGNADSSELRFRLLDADGNVLATQSFKQGTGAGIVTLPNGLSVARIPAGATYTSDSFSLHVPGASPHSVRVKLEVDKLRYHTGQDDEIAIAGRGSDKVVSLVDTAYAGEVTDVTPITSFGNQDVVITGRAFDRKTGTALPNTRLRLVLNQQGFERSFMVLTGGNGNFSYTFSPTITDAGLYKVSAIHPDLSDRPEQKTFTINRVVVGPTPFKLDIPRNYSFTIPFVAKAGPGTAATGLRYELDAASQPTGQLPQGIDLQLPAPINLGEQQSLNLPLICRADNTAQPSGSVVLDLFSNEGGRTPIGQVRINFTLSEAKPFLVSTPSFVETGLAQGGSQIESLSVQNNGLEAALNLQYTLSKPDGSPAPDWVAITSSQAGGTLAVGEKRAVDLSFTPPRTLPEGVYEFRLNVQGDNLPRQSLNIYASVTQSGRGNVVFKASDIYTATVDKQGRLIPGLAGATISLQNEDVASISHELVTNAEGEAQLQNLPAGRYKFRAKAANHQEAGGRLTIKPGITVTQPVFLDYNVITVEWSVREITIQDRYEITLNTTFETDVPAAVVVAQPASINLPKMKTGEVFYGELVLTNFGLTRADNLRQKLPASDAYFRYEFLSEVPDTLEAKQRVTLPYRIVALQSLEEAGSGANASGGGCYTYSNTTTFSCTFDCANGVQSSACGSSVSWFAASNGSCTATPTTGTGNAGSGGPTGGGGNWGGWTGWIGGGGGGSGSGAGGPGFGGGTSGPPTVLPTNQRCVAVPDGSGPTNCSP